MRPVKTHYICLAVLYVDRLPDIFMEAPRP